MAGNRAKQEHARISGPILVYLGPLWRESAPQGLGSAAGVKSDFDEIGRCLLFGTFAEGRLRSSLPWLNSCRVLILFQYISVA